MGKTDITISFPCPECGIPVKCTHYNWRTFCCQNCGESITEKDLQNALSKIKNDKSAAADLKMAAQKILIELAINSGNYSLLSGSDWTYLLQKSASNIDVCNWNCLSGGNWKDLLSSNPEYAEYCGLTIHSDKTYWKKISPNQWNLILSAQPQFQFINDLINGTNVSSHLLKNPWAEKFCDWSKVSGHDWCKILIALPAKYPLCSWDKLDGHNWVDLLSVKPEFAPFCNWNLIDDSGFDTLKRNSETLRKHVDFSKLPRNSFYRIIEKMHWGNLCDWSQISSSQEWRDILIRHPGLAPYCNWSILTSHDWAILLSLHPSLKNGCPWSKFDKNDWGKLLSAQPDMIAYYPINLKAIWNYHELVHHPALSMQLSRIFVFYSSLFFLGLFSFISLWGKTGWFSLIQESWAHSFIAGLLWVVIAIVWSYFYAKFWSGNYNRWIQLVSSFFFSVTIYTVYSWTFFFSRCSFGILLLTIFYAGILFLPCFGWFKQKRHILLSSPLLFVLSIGLLFPAEPKDYYKIARSLSMAPLTFFTASRIYFEKGNAIDPKFKELLVKINNSIDTNKWKDAQDSLKSLLLLNPMYPKKDLLVKKIEDLRFQEKVRIAEELRRNTMDAKKFFHSKNYSSAYQIALKSNKQDPEILLMLAWMYENGIGTKKNLSQAYSVYLNAAKSGDRIAQYQYAHFLEKYKDFQGKDNDRNPRVWYSNAAKKQYIPACIRLSEIFSSGLYGEVDLGKAHELVSEYATIDAFAARQLARVYKRWNNQFEASKNYATMMLLLLRRADKDDAEALYHLGKSFINGEGCDYAPHISFNFFERSYSLGYKPAALHLAKAFEQGLGTKKDFSAALSHYKVMAADGDLISIIAMGRFYLYGLGCEKSESLAKELLLKAFDRNSSEAAGYLALLFYFGSPSVKNYREAHKYALSAAVNGNALGQFILGNFYIFGHGIEPPNKEAAYKWYLSAAIQNHPEAQYNIGYMFENGDAGKVDFVEAKKWYQKAASNGNQKAKEKLRKLM